MKTNMEKLCGKCANKICECRNCENRDFMCDDGCMYHEDNKTCPGFKEKKNA